MDDSGILSPTGARGTLSFYSGPRFEMQPSELSSTRPEVVVKTIPVSALLLDPDNPRFFDLKALQGRQELTQDELKKEIMNDDEIITLGKAIRKAGVAEPIWVKETEDGGFLVLEGNRRTVILQQLLEENQKPPPGVRYDVVVANVYPANAPETEVTLQKARLQTGKKKWGAFNEAAYIYELRFTHKLEDEDIAVELQKSMKEIRHAIESFKMFREYVKITKDTNPKKFSMFDEAPSRVWDWINESPKNLATYYGLISPLNGRQKIRSVATRGGLRDFADILEDKEALDALVSDPETTVEDALEIVRENNLKMDIPFVARIGAMAAKLQSLTESQIERLKSERKVQVDIKRLQKACASVLEKMGVGN